MKGSTNNPIILQSYQKLVGMFVLKFSVILSWFRSQRPQTIYFQMDRRIKAKEFTIVV